MISHLAANDNLRAAIYLVIAMAGFTINDAFVKGIGSAINLGQVLLVRGMMATVFLLLLCLRYGHLAKIGLLRNRLLYVRVALESLSTLAFLTALLQLPFANISAIMQALPLAVTLGAIVFFGERVRFHRWTAIAIGLLGVMIIIRPGMDGFSIYSLLVLLVVLSAAGRDLITRKLPTAIPSLMVALLTSLVITILGAVLIVPMGGWAPVTLATALKLTGSAIFIVVAYHSVVLAMRCGEVSLIAPLRYTSLLWAVVLGYLFFDELPDAVTVMGAIVVILAGLYALSRERKIGLIR